MISKMTLILAISAIINFSVAGTVKAVDDSDAKDMCAAALAQVGQDGEMLTDQMFYGWLDRGESQRFSGLRSAYVTYAAVAVPLNTQNDIDLYVYDEDDNDIATDDDGKSYAVVEHTPSWSGNFKYVVKMFRRAGYYCFGIYVR